MKLERMLSIITYLLNHDKVKSQELADKFEVSVRTIYRDIDAISQAGIPIIAYQGADGGIGIMEGYKLDKSILTGDEVLKIVAGLKGLQSINEDIKIKLLID
ncbi:MAG TPA: HTH domain-containing protein, partial [Clostridia bacterium]